MVWDSQKKAVLIDPGCYTTAEQQSLLRFIEQEELHLVRLLNTHCHIDHVLGNAWAKATFGLELGIHPKDEPTLRAVESYAPSYGFPEYKPAEPDYFLDENEAIRWGTDGYLEVRFTPGHAPGHVVFWSEKDGFCINGDVLFQGSVGRTDLPGGDMATLVQSIRSQLYTLPDQTVIYCGHGPETTVANEKKYNPFVRP